MKRNLERYRIVERMRDRKAMSFQEIAELIAVSPGRASEMYRSIKRQQEYFRQTKNRWDFGLSTRAQNICNHNGITNEEELKNALLSGAIGKRTRNLGKVTYVELCKCCGLNMDLAHRRIQALENVLNNWLCRRNIEVRNQELRVLASSLSQAYQSIQRIQFAH